MQIRCSYGEHGIIYYFPKTTYLVEELFQILNPHLWSRRGECKTCFVGLSISSNVWGVCHKKFQKSYCEGSDFLQVLEEMISRCEAKECEFLVVVAKKI
jgi:hypothetical protein